VKQTAFESNRQRNRPESTGWSQDDSDPLRFDN